jgi:putative FmdB family regulatory protein
MPTYEYRCSHCGSVETRTVPVSEADNQLCNRITGRVNNRMYGTLKQRCVCKLQRIFTPTNQIHIPEGFH